MSRYKTQKAIKRAVRKNPKAAFILGILLLIIVVIGYFVYTKLNAEDKGFTLDNVPKVENGEISFHFLDLGNDSPGDSTFIKAEDKDILIDGGSTFESKTAIINYLNEYVKDGKIEFLIVSHYDSDHIAALVASGGVFDSFVIETIIDAPLTKKGEGDTTYQNYKKKLNAEIESGAKHYTALQCFNNEDGAKRSYSFGNGIKMDILYNYYYDHNTDEENDYSVCVEFFHGERRFLFTGDLEDEQNLVDKNDLGGVILYKAGHHGSASSSNECLLSKIKPTICVVNCVAGGKYNFPAQSFINRISKYTKYVYVTRVSGGKLNGTVIVLSNNTGIKINCLNNGTLLKDTEWFKENRKPTIWAS